MRTRRKKDATVLIVLSVFSLSVSIPLTLGQCEKNFDSKNRFLNLIINPFFVILQQSSEWLNLGENMRNGNVTCIGYTQNVS